MSMLKELYEAVFVHARQSSAKVEDHLGHPYHVDHEGATALQWPKPRPVPQPQTLNVGTLSGLVAVLKANIDEWNLDHLQCICEPGRVTVVQTLDGGDIDYSRNRIERPQPLVATYHAEKWLDRNHALMEFRVNVVRCFEPSEERQRLLEDTAAFRFESADVREETADGLGVSTTDKRDRMAGGRHKISNPVYTLRPYRSFPEAGDQIEVPFLCQIQGGEDEPTTATLSDVGGNAWRHKVAHRVGLHVQKLCNEANLDVAVVW